MTLTDLIEREYGGRGWVVARRTANIVRKYGEDVICLSPKKMRRLKKQLEIETAADHPACPWLKVRFGDERQAVAIIRALREGGFRIEKVHGE